jgi:single-stranded-DNA-specific exonuclease
MKKIWQIAPSPPVDFIESISPVSSLLGLILWNRGFQTAQAVKDFLNNELDPALTLKFSDDDSLTFYNPFLFRDMEKAVDLIISHIKKGSKIMVYGDYDADGVTASSVLAEALNTMQVKTEVYLPDRVSEGYGLNKTALDEIKAQGFSLVITVDNGIRNREEAKYAKELGLDLIITDHHVLPDEADLPDCLVIDPADKSDNYPWPYLAGVGVAFKLVCALLHRSKLDLKQKRLIAERSLDLVAVGTIADLVNLMGENRLLVKKGLEVLNEKRRPGLNALFKIAKITLDKPLEAWNVGWQLGPRLNAASRVGHANSAFALINAKTETEAEELALELNRRNLSRQQITEDIMKQVESQVDPDNLPPLIIGVAPEDQFWNEGVVGLVSGKICEKYHRPTLVIARIIEEADADLGQGKMIAGKLSFKGSGRSIEGFNLIEAIAECSEHLDKYGGHPMACGFSVESEEKLRAFREKLSQLAANRLKAEDLIPKLKLDAQVSFKEISLSLVEEVNSLAPYGQNNPQPRLLSSNLRIEDIVFMGTEKQHIKLRLADALEVAAPAVWAIDFKVGDKYAELEIGDVIDLAYYLDINDFNGRRELQLKIIDWRLSQST